jgi:hypothetical protein
MKLYCRRVSQNHGFPHFPLFPSMKSIGLTAENCYEIHKLQGDILRCKKDRIVLLWAII